MRRTILAILALTLPAGCGAAATQAPPTPDWPTVVPTVRHYATRTSEPGALVSERITKEDIPDEWPFTADAGMLGCQSGAVTFTTGGNTYAVNGAAKGAGKYLALEEIWADSASIPGTKASVGPVIARGLALCE